MKRSRDFRIDGSARHDWEYLSIPNSIDDVVEALFGLPDNEVGEARTSDRPDWRTAHGHVLGRMFMVGGEVNSDGEWTRIALALPVWPPIPPRGHDDES